MVPSFLNHTITLVDEHSLAEPIDRLLPATALTVPRAAKRETSCGIRRGW
jgi:hypothetical protein